MDINGKKEFNNPQALTIWFSIGIVFLVALFFTSFQTANNTNRTNVTKQNGDVTLVIDYGSSQQKWSGQFQDKVRVWDLLQQATAISNTALAATGNFIPHKIDGHQSNDKQGWQYYMNGVLQNTPPFETFASVGDEVVFKWEAYDDVHQKKW